MAIMVRRRKEDASDPKSTKIGVAEDSSPTLVNRPKSASARNAGIKNKIAKREERLERAMKNTKT
jgi:hypothetical protein